ncbi:MAG: flagellar basal body rod protein FlgB [Armatimonadia bacterium]
MSSYLTDNTVSALSKALQGQALRQRTVANNLANVDTPGYRPQRVDFEAQLRHALASADSDNPASSAVIDAIRPQASTSSSPALRRDGNAVDLETEMVALAESSTHYNALIRLLSKKLQMLKSVATEGGK